MALVIDDEFIAGVCHPSFDVGQTEAGGFVVKMTKCNTFTRAAWVMYSTRVIFKGTKRQFSGSKIDKNVIR